MPIPPSIFDRLSNAEKNGRTKANPTAFNPTAAETEAGFVLGDKATWSHLTPRRKQSVRAMVAGGWAINDIHKWENPYNEMCMTIATE